MSTRIQCKIPNCNRMILPATYEKTNGLCMPCYQALQRIEFKKYVQENKKTIDLFDGIHDPVEIIKLMHQDRKYDPLLEYLPYPRPIEELYRELSEHEQAALVAFCIEKAKLGNTELIELICLELVAFKNTDLTKLHEFMLENSEYFPGMLFKNAKSHIVKDLLQRLNEDVKNRNLILQALAWAGDENVVAKFFEWSSSPPSWGNEFYCPVSKLSQDAGWIINHTKKKKKLFLEKCYPLLLNENMKNASDVPVCTPSEISCKWCNGKLTNLFIFDLNNPIFEFLPFEGNKLTIATCEVCVTWVNPIFMEVSNAGEVSWSICNEKIDKISLDPLNYMRMPMNKLYMSKEPRAVDYAANWSLPTTFSQIGGMPTWIQDPAYPDCPKCKNTMVFIAQIAKEDFKTNDEGMYYNHICFTCNITATGYQQT